MRKAFNRGDYQKASVMKGRKRREGLLLSVMFSELMLASWETITRRSILILQNDCSPAEYRRMANEKVEAAARSAARLVSGSGRAKMSSPGALALSRDRQREALAKKVGRFSI